MAVTREQIIEALREVYDPELHRSIVDLHMVRSVDICGGAVRVKVALTVAGCPLQKSISQSISERLRRIPGVEHVEVELGTMTDEERKRLVAELSPRPEVRSAILDEDSKTIIVGISSGKGGVGKSTVTTNLAVALAQQGFKVGIIDADIYGFSIPHMMGVGNAPVVLEDRAIIPQTAHGVQFISMGSFVDEKTPVVWRGPMLTKAFQQFLGDVLWADLDYLLVDMPPGTGDIALSMYQLIPQGMLLLVTTPQPVAANVASRVAAMAKKTGQTLLGIVENMSYFRCPHCEEVTPIFGAGAGEAMAEQLGVPLLGKVPLQVELREGADAGRPLSDPHTAAVFAEIAHRFHERAQSLRGGRVGARAK
ncbi:MAG: Mrp/NBP35 family ATP-binding protein [Limnochordales bacterium]|nr:Mrp/NBP35 family ATP-binding protein [Limnochordales bacterium]